EQGVSLNDFLASNFGEYCSEDTIRLMLEQYYLNANYNGKYNIENQVTDEEIADYYEKNKNDYYQINFSYIALEYDTSSDESKTECEDQAKKYVSEIKTRDQLVELAPEVYKSYIESDAQTAMDSDETLSEEDAIKQATETYLDNIDGTVTGSDAPFGDEINDWLFSDDTPTGSTNYYIDETYGYIYVILKTEEPTRLDDETYTVRHILVCPDIDALNNASQTGEDVSFTDEQWDAAKEKADKILEEYNNGDKTEYSFAVLAEENSDDTASTTAGSSNYFGGICEAVTIGQMVPEFESWAVDDSRKYADVDIVKSDYGYHIMFFINDVPQYEADIISSIKNERISNLADSAEVDIHNSVFEKTIVANPSSTDEAAE
ncbi:MAG: peptidylprolyl isomerase, partial [Eubacterium sp.]